VIALSAIFHLARLSPSLRRESRFYIQLACATRYRYTPDSYKDDTFYYMFCLNFFSGLCHRCLWRRSFGNFREWVSFSLDSPRLTRLCIFFRTRYDVLYRQQHIIEITLDIFTYTLWFTDIVSYPLLSLSPSLSLSIYLYLSFFLSLSLVSCCGMLKIHMSENLQFCSIFLAI